MKICPIFEFSALHVSASSAPGFSHDLPTPLLRETATVRVTLQNRGKETKTVIVRITDRGPSMDLVREGRIIDLTRTAFMRLAAPHHGLVAVKVEPVRTQTRTN